MDLKRSGDPENKQYNPPQIAWLSSLRFKLGVGLFLLFLILVCSNLWLIWFKGLPLLVQQSKELNEQIGQNIVTELNQQFMQAETLTKDIANLAEALPTEDQLFKSTIPHLLDLESMPTSSPVEGSGLSRSGSTQTKSEPVFSGGEKPMVCSNSMTTTTL